MKSVVIGVDIGGTFSKFGIVDREGNILVEGSIPTDTFENVVDYQKSLYEAIEKAIAPIKSDIDIKGIGFGAPNANYYKGTIESAANLKWKGVVHFAELFKKYYNFPIVLTNDANAAAIGEGLYGGAKGMQDYIVITLGTGLGSGIVANGKMIYGFDGFAGELGHVMVEPNGRKCGCGKLGCLETYASATGIKRTVFKLLCDMTDESELRQYNFYELTSEKIYEAALRNDPVALKAFEFTGNILGAKLADAVAFSTPEAIFLFGGLAKAGEVLFKPIRESFEANLLPIYRNKIKILPSGLQDKNVAVMGASALIWKELGN
ncbi:MAG: ROK family protein [Bacteroidota bacterium]|nr:ROK family protein [Bacteroidota bacterium]